MSETSVVKSDAKPVKRDPTLDPLTEIKRQMLAAAGLDPVKGGEKLRAALEKAESLLEAKRVQYFSKDGVVTDERADDDGQLQLAAARYVRDLMVELFDDSKASKGAVGNINVQVNVSGWFDDESGVD